MISEMDLSGPSEIDFGIEEFDDEDSDDADDNDEEDGDEDGDDDYDSVGILFYVFLVLNVILSFRVIS